MRRKLLIKIELRPFQLPPYALYCVFFTTFEQKPQFACINLVCKQNPEAKYKHNSEASSRWCLSRGETRVIRCVFHLGDCFVATFLDVV
jgi:hypothetical protein